MMRNNGAGPVLFQGLVRMLLLICLWCGILSTTAQTPGISYDLSWFGGEIVRHTPKLKFEVPALSQGVELALRFQKYGTKEWHARQGYPTTGLLLSYFDFGDGAVLGRAYSLSGMLELYFYRNSHWDIYFQPAAGIGLLDRPYDALTNTAGNAVGSVLNSAVSFRIGGHIGLTPHWRLHAGIAFSHWSNGGSYLPNFGINLPAVQLGAEYAPARVSPDAFTQYEKRRLAGHRWGLQAYAGYTQKEAFVPDGPSYPFYSVSLAAMYAISPCNRLQLGVEYELDMSIYRFGQHILLFQDRAEAFEGASRRMVFLANEFRFGHSGILVQVGTYLGDTSVMVPWTYYNKLGYRYYFRDSGRHRVRPHIGIYMKSHKIIAEYFALGAGFAL